MIIPDKRKAAMLIVSRMRGAKDGPEDSGEMEDGGDDLESLVSDLMDSLKSDDVSGAASALRAVFAALEAEPHEEAGET